MAYHGFSLFPGSPSLRDLFNKRAIRYHWRDGGPVFTTAILLICVAVWLIELLLSLVWPSGLVAMLNVGAFQPMLATRHPWTFLTSMFLHQPTSILHILFNMLTLWSVAPMLERMMGHWSFLTLYVLSGIGGGFGMMAWGVLWPGGAGWLNAAYGASGALFGLFAAMLVVYRRIGADISSMMVWMVINFAMPVVVPNIAWQAHVGGFLIGGLFTWLLVTPKLQWSRGKSLQYRTTVYGTAVFVLMLVLIAVCELFNPGSVLGLLG
ncbi:MULTISPECIES: rhomboid family intramembrane serine protease [Bifidobacterium]|uniref:rhomboid family intramembrane serine protease n=1 Tax=Bifidobacterium TaxID=1678 RepID=UPI001BDC1F04|nr:MULTISPECIES: rhomboid family intramembrane serine protease [Bifidobacterium]MBT1162692.1 rhomboid family intramembrane serine protease [Bifidobacterium sp. SO1]MBW3079719.1 rhomboid family intramembrane serine protease [Bifidobacterium simiiventris]